MADFQTLGAQVVGVSADPPATLAAFQQQASVRHRLLSDGRRQVLSAYGALVTDEKSPMRGYAKRAYFVIDREGVVRYAKINENPLDLLAPAEILQALRESGAR